MEKTTTWEKIKSIILWVIVAILGVFVIFAGSVFIQSQLNPDHIPSIFGYKPFVVLSGSMTGELNEGDLAIVKEVDNSEIVVGDVIAFLESEENIVNPDKYEIANKKYVVTHRVDSIEEVDGETRIYTKGDQNNAVDAGYTTYDKIEGKLVGKFAGLGRVVLAMQEPVTLIICLIFVVLIAIYFIFDSRTKMTKADIAELKKLRAEQAEKSKNEKK